MVAVAVPIGNFAIAAKSWYQMYVTRYRTSNLKRLLAGGTAVVMKSIYTATKIAIR